MSADLLRDAAAKMRERAEYAPDSPWAADVRSDGRAWIDVADEDGHAWGMHGFPRAAEHIASWHPAVALAVSDWLEAEATSMDALAVFASAAATIEHKVDIRGASLTVTKGDKGELSLRADTSRPAIAVARAYLGSDQ